MLHSILRTNDAQAALIAIKTMAHNINDVDEYGRTPLVILARRRYNSDKTALKFFRACVRAGAKVDQHAGDNRTALYHAIDFNSVFAVRALLHFGARVDLVVDGSYSLLTKAVLVGNVDIVRVLHRCASPRALRIRDCVTGDTYLHEMIDKPGMGNLLLELARGDAMHVALEQPNHAGETPFMRANRRLNVNAIQAIMYARAGVY